ncbi:unnamed protein product, partial [Didymodactylos carnosus]
MSRGPGTLLSQCYIYEMVARKIVYRMIYRVSIVYCTLRSTPMEKQFHVLLQKPNEIGERLLKYSQLFLQSVLHIDMGSTDNVQLLNEI